MTKILICGSRDFDNYKLLEYIINQTIFDNGLNYNNIEIVSWGAKGADALSELFAKNNNIKIKVLRQIGKNMVNQQDLLETNKWLII